MSDVTLRFHTDFPLTGSVDVVADVEYEITNWARKEYEITDVSFKSIICRDDKMCGKSCLSIDDWAKLHNEVEENLEHYGPVSSAEARIEQTEFDAAKERRREIA